MANDLPTPPENPPAPGGEGALPGYPERVPSERRRNRLRARVSIALLGGKAAGPVPEAVRYLREVVAGKHPLAERTRTAAAQALLRAGIDVSEAPKSAPSIDARSVTVNIGTGEGAALPSVPEAVRAALAAFRTDATRDGAP
jgi:hypothetical protein